MSKVLNFVGSEMTQFWCVGWLMSALWVITKIELTTMDLLQNEQLREQATSKQKMFFSLLMESFYSNIYIFLIHPSVLQEGSELREERRGC